MRYFFAIYSGVTRDTKVSNKMGGSTSCLGMFGALIPKEGANPHIFLRHCMQPVDLPMQEQLLWRHSSYVHTHVILTFVYLLLE